MSDFPDLSKEVCAFKDHSVAVKAKKKAIVIQYGKKEIAVTAAAAAKLVEELQDALAMHYQKSNCVRIATPGLKPE